MASREVIGIAGGFTGAPRGVERLDGAAVLAAKVVEIRNVVIRLGHEKRHVVLLAEGAGSLISGKGARKIIQTDQADSHVAEDNGDAFGVFVRHQFGVSALIVRDRFFEPVLAVIDVPDVDFQAGQAPWIVQTRKYLPGAISGLKRPVVLAQEDHRLDRTAQSPRGFAPNAQRLVKAESLLMVLDGGPIIAGGIKSVRLCPQTKRQNLFPPQPFRDDHLGLIQVKCFLRAYTDFLNDQLRELLDNLLADQRLVPREKLAARPFAGELPQLGDQLVVLRIPWC